MLHLRENRNSCYHGWFLPPDDRHTMRPTFEPVNDQPLNLQPTPLCADLLVLQQSGKRLSKPTLLVTALLAALVAPLTAQAVLPATIEAALRRADLSAADISIMITPVGDKNANRLPAAIQVIDSSRVDKQPKLATQPTLSTATATKPKNETATDANNIKQQATLKHKNNSPSLPSPLTTIEKQTIQQHEKQLHAYTDDPYTHQSLESRSTVLSSIIGSNNNHDDSSNNHAAMVATQPLPLTAPLLSHQPDSARTPASTMKLIPSFIALDALGADFVWHTRVYHTGITIGNRLHGDLIIQGSGDPKMTHERLQQLLYRVQKAGIRHIDGDIIVDSAVFQSVSKDPGAFDNAPLRPYNASPDGFLVNFNSMSIQSYPQQNGQARLLYSPLLANYQLPSAINTRAAACTQAGSSLAPQWQTNMLTLNAKLPDSCGEHVFYVAYPDAKDFAARVIAAKWQQLGNTLSGKVLAQETPYSAASRYKNKAATPFMLPKSANDKPQKHGLAALPVSPLPIVSYPSLNLTQQIYDINHFSNNVMTEQVALSLGAYSKRNNTVQSSSAQVSTDNSTSLYQFGQPTMTSYPAALEKINLWWQTHLTTPPPYLTNGSGLCRDCTVTAANLNELLGHAYSHPSFGAYVGSLGIAGVSGTIVSHSERLPESAAIGRAWIKTGTLSNVTSMAGYVKGQSGQEYSVVGLINTEQALNPYTARPVLDAMLDWTAQH